ncbi:glyoxylate/hydroxypyruvate reductase A [Methylobacterium sp. Leaf87]|uniref:2-hydroxyacid dehydrogenase n=1 Tax=Methylobacterium sp. Leaf87 TaxID=1736243 RepID=UPI0006F48A31|nr:glyoxylate/hydroxypyruvate reductase A [Methylobacterium sp. Leaf87]KQO66080.1 glyoxylate/hydroxypyruvate reductase A [Methylobacterium sp. Leaf87]
MPTPLLLETSLGPDEEAEWLAALTVAMPDEAIITGGDDAAIRRNAEIAIVANPRPGSLQDLPRLRWVQSLWAGVDALLGDATVPDVPVVRLVDPSLAGAMAEAVAAAVLYLHRDLHLYASQQRRREWRPHPVRSADHRRVTILGMGEMGRASAALLRTIGFPVSGWSRSGADCKGVTVHSGREGLWSALAQADILVNLLPLTPTTRGVLNRDVFGRLPRGAGLVNYGRGAHVVEADLLEALTMGLVGHAVLDVFENEPLPVDHRLWATHGVTILPHVAAPTSRSSAADIVAGAVRTYRLTGYIPQGVDRTRGY